MKRFTSIRSMQGFSLIEVLIVTSITLTVAGVAVPKMINSIANLELRSAVHSASGVIQQTRMQAIKGDKALKAKYWNGTGGGFVFADSNDNGTPESTEPQAQLGSAVLAYSAPTAIPALTSTDLGYSTVTTTSVQFSATGQPCTVVTGVMSSSTICPVGMVMYFTDTRSMGSPGWAAVSVAPAGRVACWMWDGTKWAQN